MPLQSMDLSPLDALVAEAVGYDGMEQDRVVDGARIGARVGARIGARVGAYVGAYVGARAGIRAGIRVGITASTAARQDKCDR